MAKDYVAIQADVRTCEVTNSTFASCRTDPASSGGVAAGSGLSQRPLRAAVQISVGFFGNFSDTDRMIIDCSVVSRARTWWKAAACF